MVLRPRPLGTRPVARCPPAFPTTSLMVLRLRPDCTHSLIHRTLSVHHLPGTRPLAQPQPNLTNLRACRRAVLLMQNDVTSRIEAENVLTGLSEGQVRGETRDKKGGEQGAGSGMPGVSDV